MHAPHFDRLVQSLAASGSRRGLLRLFTALPLLAFLLALLAPRSSAERAMARHRNSTRQSRRHKHRHQVQDQRKRKKKKGKKRCSQAGQTPRRGQPCCSGLVEDAAGTCVPPAPACEGDTCAACTASTQCPAGTLCHEGSCQACDVCASSCTYRTVQAAVADFTGPGTLRLCAGTYSGHVAINRNLQLIGAGDGARAGDTILAGPGNSRVVTITGGLSVTLQRLRITGGGGILRGGGIHTSANEVTLVDCTVTGNSADLGGGMYIQGTFVRLTDSSVHGNLAAIGGGIANVFNGMLTLDHSDVTTNTATVDGGGIYNGLGTVTLLSGSRITGNRAIGIGNSRGGVYNTSTINPAGGTITGNTPNDCVNVWSGTGCPE